MCFFDDPDAKRAACGKFRRLGFATRIGCSLRLRASVLLSQRVVTTFIRISTLLQLFWSFVAQTFLLLSSLLFQSW